MTGRVRVAGVEAGGTKFVCAIGGEGGHILDRAVIRTSDPDETIAAVLAFLAPHRPTSLGIGSFGPIVVDPRSPQYGVITNTPKAGWAGTDLLGRLSRGLGAAGVIDTDVNAAALAEHRWGAAQGLDCALYLTVGTGIGGGAIVRGHPLHGRLHPEMGHILVPRAPGDTEPSVCPFHGCCLEGLASGPALERRLGGPARLASPDHPALDTEARTLAAGIVSLMSVLSPERVIVGGGIMHISGLLERVRHYVRVLSGGYLSLAPDDDIARLVCPPALGDDAGLLGALALGGWTRG